MTYPKQQCTRQELKEVDAECDIDLGTGLDSHRCRATGLYKGIGLEGDKHPDSDCSVWSGELGDTEWCLGVSCQDEQVQDQSACKQCSSGYEGSAQTTHSYTKEVIGNLCINEGYTNVNGGIVFYNGVWHCPSGYTDVGDHPTSESLCSDDRLMVFVNRGLEWGDPRTALCQKQATQRVSHTTQCIKKIVDFCAGTSCSNHGSCSNGATTYTCDCNAGFSGTACETNIDDCFGKSCFNHGSCIDGVDAYTCNCNPGWGGVDCSISTTTTTTKTTTRTTTSTMVAITTTSTLLVVIEDTPVDGDTTASSSVVMTSTLLPAASTRPIPLDVLDANSVQVNADSVQVNSTQQTSPIVLGKDREGMSGTSIALIVMGVIALVGIGAALRMWAANQRICFSEVVDYFEPDPNQPDVYAENKAKVQEYAEASALVQNATAVVDCDGYVVDDFNSTFNPNDLGRHASINVGTRQAIYAIPVAEDERAAVIANTMYGQPNAVLPVGPAPRTNKKKQGSVYLGFGQDNEESML